MVISSEKNLYEILGVSTDATLSVIKASYRRLVRTYHPDLNHGDENCARRFKEINEAYEILSNAQKKLHYDTTNGIFRHTTSSQAKRKQANSAYRQTQTAEKKQEKRKSDTVSSPQRAAESFDFSEVFNDILKGFKDTTTSARKAFKERKEKLEPPKDGTDVVSEVSIALQEAVNGCERTINVLHTASCKHCMGKKFINGSKCPICGGSGEQNIHKKINVKIPANVKSGSKIRIAEEGNKGSNGGRDGDLYLIIKIEDNSIFKYSGLNLLCTVPITPFEAVLGGEIEIPTPRGDVKMKIMPNTHSGQKFRLSDLGLKGQNGEVGDIIVTTNIEIPHTLSDNEIKLYQKLKDIASNNIRENFK